MKTWMTRERVTTWTRSATLLTAFAMLFSLVGAAGGAAPASTIVGGEITFNTTWTLVNSPYIVTANVQVQPGVTLTIQPGVVVKFESGKKILTLGTLIAQGTAANPITFTSNLPNPQPGFWGNIVFRNTSALAPTQPDAPLVSSILQHCVVEYGGGVEKGAIFINEAPALVDSCTVRYSSSGGIRAIGAADLGVVVSNNTVSNNFVTGDGGGISAVQATVVGNTLTNNHATGFGGGVYAASSTVGGNTILSNMADRGGGVYAFASTINNNNINSNAANRGGGVFSDGSKVTWNNILRNTTQERGAGAYLIGASVLQYNNVLANASVNMAGILGGVEIQGTPVFTHNNIYRNLPFDVVVVTSNDVHAENNYWGSFSTADILAHTYDFFDNNQRGLLLFSPQLPDPDPNAPVPPPLNLRSHFTNGSVTLNWDSVPALTTSYTYRVYYDDDSALPPYNGSGLTQGSSPIAVGSAIGVTLDGPGLESTYFAVTARDSLGRESWYSNVEENLEKVYSPLILK